MVCLFLIGGMDHICSLFYDPIKSPLSHPARHVEHLLYVIKNLSLMMLPSFVFLDNSLIQTALKLLLQHSN